jgi:hypothetical protein
MLIKLLTVTIPVVLGVAATFFAPSKLRIRAIFIISGAFIATGVFGFIIANHYMMEDSEALIRLFKSRSPDLADYAQHDWMGFWANTCLSGTGMTLFGIGACLGCGIRKVLSCFRG